MVHMALRNGSKGKIGNSILPADCGGVTGNGNQKATQIMEDNP